MVEVSYSEWLEQIKSHSGICVDQYLAYMKEDTENWADTVWDYWSDHLEVYEYAGILLEGEKGTGKHTALASFLNLFAGADGYGYQVYFFDPLTLPVNQQEYFVFEKHINELLESLKSEAAQCLFVFDDIDSLKDTQFILRLLPSLVQRCSADDYKLYYLAVSNKIIDVPSAFSRITYRLVFTETTAEQRKRYLSLRAEKLISLYDTDSLVEQIGDCTFSELTDIVRVLQIESKSRTLSTEEITAIVDKYVLSSYKKKARNPVMDAFFERLKDTLSQTPVQYGNTIASVNSIQSSTVINAVSENVPVDKNDAVSPLNAQRKEYEEMPPNEFMIKLFGKDGVQEILQA